MSNMLTYLSRMSFKPWAENRIGINIKYWNADNKCSFDIQVTTATSSQTGSASSFSDVLRCYLQRRKILSWEIHSSLNMSLYCVKYLFINQIYSFSNKKKWKKIKKKKKNDAWKTPLYQENSTFLNCQYLGFLMTNFTFLLCSHKILANAVEWLNSENVSCALRHTSCHR